ncbi:hypothetical protein [Paenibacillus taichungensis]|uniref:hypothetical protein n=1 Tax=Paenibacillus taichungensis TaxID=484184 RepID=UPI0035D98143
MLNQYESMIGKHFTQVEIKLLCALVDQRMEKELPSTELRLCLSEEIQKFGHRHGYLTDPQRKAHERVRRDITKYPDKKELVFIQCTHRNGTEFTISISDNRIIWNTSGHPTSVTFRYVTHKIDNNYIRTLVPKVMNELSVGAYTTQSSVFEEIYFNDVADCSDYYLLEALFTVSEQEKKIHGTKICMECGQRTAVPAPALQELSVIALGKPNDGIPVLKYQCQSCSTVFYK